jgi:hypothetical protein
MTTTNGKRKNGNGNSSAKTAEMPTQIAQSTEQLEGLLSKTENKPETTENKTETTESKAEQTPETVKEEPIQNTQEQPSDAPQPQVSAEDILKQAKQQAKQAETKAERESQLQETSEPTDETGEQGGAIAPKTATSEMGLALGDAAKSLIENSQQAKQQRLETGIREGYEQAQDIRTGRQLGTLLALAESEHIDAVELDEQLEKLRQHTDAQTANVVSEAIKKLGIGNQKKEVKSPLESTLSKGRLPSKGNSFKIL